MGVKRSSRSDLTWSVRSKAIAGVWTSNFFSLWLGQGQTQRAVRTQPIVDGDSPPTEGKFSLRRTGKGQGYTSLMRAHTTGHPVAPLNGRGIRFSIAQVVKQLMDTSLGALRVSAVHLHDATTLGVFDDLNVRPRARDAVALHRRIGSSAILRCLRRRAE